ncbi:uncharacterized protein FYW49_000329 [Xenentodon cancila]
MSESLSMQHNLSTSKLSSDYCYKKKFEESTGHYHMIPDTPEQLHLKEASELQSNVKYKEKYEKEKRKAMLDFETATYVTAKEAQHMQSQVNTLVVHPCDAAGGYRCRPPSGSKHS